jgi:enterochelin esterase family protein
VSPPIRELLERDGGPDQAAAEAFLAGRAVPIVSGPRITFVWRGEADEVNLRHFIFGLGASQPLERIAGTDLWFRTLEVPPGSRFEYKFEIVRGGSRTWIRDPLNPHTARDPFGANSVCHGTGYEVPEWVHADPQARPGILESTAVPTSELGGERPLAVYLPARMRATRRYPLLVVFDGLDYVRYARLQTVLDNLIHRHEIAPMIVALSPSDDRFGEYTANPAHARFVVQELLPFLEARFPVRPTPAARGLMGASLGAVAALSTAWRHPGVFGRLLLQSGSFAFTDIGESDRGPVLSSVVPFVNAFREAPGRLADRIYLTCGTYESLIYENRALAALLQGTRNDVRYVEARDGHNWENWRDRLREGLSWLFPGPIGLVYE